MYSIYGQMLTSEMLSYSLSNATHRKKIYLYTRMVFTKIYTVYIYIAYTTNNPINQFGCLNIKYIQHNETILVNHNLIVV